MSDDPQVRAAVLASITPTEARWLAQNSDVTMRYCTDELMSWMMRSQPATIAAWREAEGVEPPTEQTPWRDDAAQGAL